MAEDKEVSEVFLKTLDSFYKESEVIFKEFDAILVRHKQGEDIMDALHEFRIRRSSIFCFIDAIFHKKVEFEDKLAKAEIGKEKQAKLREFKDRFADLAEEIDLFVLKEIGVDRW
jgi:ACT domain-containing protein